MIAKTSENINRRVPFDVIVAMKISDGRQRQGGSMRFDRGTKTLGILFCAILLTSCRSMGGDGGAPSLIKLGAGAEPPAANAQLTGTLIRQSDCFAVDGNGNTIVVWPRTANAVSRPGNGNVIIVRPRQAAARIDRENGGGEAGINGVVVWPMAAGVSAPVRVGQRVELIGDMKDDMSGLALQRPAPRGCSGRAFVVRDFRPAAAR